MKSSDILKINNSLNAKVWSGNQLAEKVRSKLTAVAEEFFKKLELDNVTLEDITFTGSLANYNYTKYSDIDLHLLVDFSKVDENVDLVREYFSAKTALWNKTHNIFVNGYEIEIYVQDISEDHHSTGVFSMKNQEWIAEPVKLTPSVNTDMVKRKISSFVDMIERVEDEYDNKDYKKTNDMSSSLVKKIKKFRQSGLEALGEYSNENLAFKYLRNKGFLKNLFELRDISYDRMMSLEGDYGKKFKIFVNQGHDKQKNGFHKLQEEEKFQRLARIRRNRGKKWFLSKGKQAAGSAFPNFPSYTTGVSAPPAGE
tara:strand:+ start:421 stop:1356 length:936 start_codon:yes stop_codon:yes gene_type:complete